MFIDGRNSFVKERCHLLLRQPHRFRLQLNFDFRQTTGICVDDNFTLCVTLIQSTCLSKN